MGDILGGPGLSAASVREVGRLAGSVSSRDILLDAENLVESASFLTSLAGDDNFTEPVSSSAGFGGADDLAESASLFTDLTDGDVLPEPTGFLAGDILVEPLPPPPTGFRVGDTLGGPLASPFGLPVVVVRPGPVSSLFSNKDIRDRAGGVGAESVVCCCCCCCCHGAGAGLAERLAARFAAIKDGDLGERASVGLVGGLRSCCWFCCDGAPRWELTDGGREWLLPRS